MKKIKEVISSVIRKESYKGRGVISIPKKYVGKRVKVIIYYNQFSKLHRM